jgi:adenylate cyclase
MAVSIDPNDADAHGTLAFALFACREITAAWDHVEKALAISPSCAVAYQVKGLLLVHSGHPAKGRENFLLALQHDPRTMDVRVSALLGMSYYFEYDYENAVEILRRKLAENPTHSPAYRWLAAALGQLGRIDEAREAITAAIATGPESFARYTRKRAPWFRPEDFEHMLDGLRKAGWQG